MGQDRGAAPAGDEAGYVAPALGERRAMGGYYPQYHGGAGLILEELRLGRLEWIRVADPRAGATDDVQIGTPGRVDAYQFKWSQFPGTVTFRNLTSGTAEDRPLIAVLADGWTRLRQVHPGRRVVVHLRTNDQPSVNDRPGGEGGYGPHHFSAFVQREWIPRSTGRAWAQTELWREAWTTIQKASGLAPDEFERFVAECKLEFGVNLPGPNPAGGAAQVREEEAYRRDLDALNVQLQRWVIDPRGIVEVSKEDLLVALGWQERLEFRSVHRFPNASPYREVAVTARDLDSRLRELPGGYIVLLGTPGSGKSTLLSNALRYRAERVVHYYAFVPDTPNAHRGESINFLHDIVLELARGGLRTGRTLPLPDVELLSAQLREQLRAAGAEHRETGRKTVLVIDGLDHIAREQDPVRTLLRDLPEPGVIPEGVYFILGSQTDALPGLTAAVRVQIEEPGRRIYMAPLNPADVVSAVSEAGLEPQPKPEEARRIFEISAGHPLALAYVLNQLRSARGQPVTAVLNLAEPYGGEIAVQYRSHWQQIEDDFALVRLLALLARARGPIRVEWVESWADAPAWNRLRRRFGHYFRSEHNGDLRFFHNSFRAFLLERTRGMPGLGGPRGDGGLYAQLAEHSRAAPEGSPARWDEIHYLAMARDIPAVVAAATRQAFAEQFFAGRAPSAILDDIRLALSVVAGTRDEVVLTRLLLLAAEFERRTRSLDEIALEELLLELSGPAAALTHARDDRRLLTSPERAFHLARELQDLGWEAEAAALFSLAEPVDVLSGAVPVSAGHAGNLDLLVEWGEIAPRFRSMEVILRAADQLRAVEGQNNWERLAPHLPLYSVRLAVSRSLSELGRDAEWEEVVSAWNPAEERDKHWWFAAHRSAWDSAWLDNRPDRARELARRVGVEFAQRPADLAPDQRVALAVSAIVFERDFEAARGWVDGLSQPDPVEVTGIRGDEGLAPYRGRFALNRVLGALGDERPLSELVPDRAEPDYRALSVLERQVALVGRLWGRAWQGDRLAPGSFMVEIGPMLRLVRRDPRETGNYYAGRARPELLQLLVRAAAAHGLEVLRALRDGFEREWQNGETNTLWRAELIRDVLLAFVRQDDEYTAWAREWLLRLELRAFDAHDVEERVSAGVAFALAAAELGDMEMGQRLYRGALGSSFGLTGKDYQMSSWVEFAEQANTTDAVRTPERLGRLIGYSPLLDGTEGEHAVIEKLLRLTCEWNLGAGVRLLEWDLEQALLEFPSGVAVLLDQALVSHPELVHAVSALLRHVVLSVVPHGLHSLVRGVAEALVREAVDPAAEIAKVEHAVLTCAPASARPQLLDELAAIRRAAGLPVPRVEIPPPAENGGSDRDEKIELADGDLSLDAAQKRAVDLDGVRDLLCNARPGAYQRWGRVVEPLVAQLDIPSASALADLFRDVPDSGDVLTLVARRLAVLGAMDRAWRVSKQAFTTTRPVGWVEYYDGGIRRRAIELMVEAAPDRGRALAWETLTTDVASGNVRAQDVAAALPWILPVLSPAPDIIGVWSEVEAYLAALFAHAQAAEPPGLASGEPGEEPVVVLLAWAALYLDHPTLAVAVMVKRAFVDLLVSGAPGVRPVLAERLHEGRPSERRAALLVLQSAAEARPNLVVEMAADLRPLLVAPDHMLRSGARRLLEQVGEEVEEPALGAAAPGTMLAMPTSARIVLPPRGSVRDRQLERGEPLPITKDPVELTGSIEEELSFLARLSGLQREVLQYRAAELMFATSPDVGSPEAERSVMSQVRRAGLDLGSFRRPRAMHARDALLQLVVVLEQEGRLNTEKLEVFDGVFRYDDPTVLRLPVSSRPIAVPPIAERGVDRYPPENWTDLVVTASSTLHQPQDGWFVLAEWSKVRWLYWKRPTEIRFAVRLPAAHAPLPGTELGPEEQCSVLYHVRAVEYPEAEVDPVLPVVFNQAYRFDSLRHGWLALNPALARNLGWQPDPAGLFRWRDEFGDVAAETIMWSDGSLHLPPPRLEEEVGNGWLVRVSPGAATRLEEVLGPLAGVIQVHRTREESPTRWAAEYLDGLIG